MEKYLVLATFVGSVIALLFALFTGKRVLRFEEGTPLMSKISRSIREGANAYLRRQYTVVGIFFACMIVVLCIMAACDLLTWFVPFAFLTGGFFSGVDFITAFSDCNASAGLVMGSSIALLFTFVFYRVREVMTFQDFAACIPEGFKAMVSPMLILSLAWTLSGMTGLLGAKYYVANLLGSSAAALQYLLPFIIFLVAVFLAFATGTSWGTFSILIPIVCHAFPQGEMLVISIAACLSGAVCGDHCSPISDTTIMASAGAHCYHLNHVFTQIPYALTVAGVAFVSFILAGIIQNVVICLIIACVLMVATLLVIRAIMAKKHQGIFQEMAEADKALAK